MVDVSEKMIEAGLAAAKDQLPLYYSTDDEIRAAVHAIYTAMHSAREVDGETVERVRHLQRGTEYTVIGVGRAQGSLADEDPIVLYRGDDGGLWARHYAEFTDGRFDRITQLEAALSDAIDLMEQMGLSTMEHRAALHQGDRKP